MKPLLMIMNPRRIPECIDSLESLDIDRAWFTGMSQETFVEPMREIVHDTDYDVYLLVSDDCIVTQEALDAVLALLEAGHPAATGWCRLDRTHELANITSEPLRSDRPRKGAYVFWPAADVIAYPEPVVPTWFMGNAISGVTRDLRVRHPYGVFFEPRFTGASDLHLSVQLHQAGVPMVAARAGFVDHVKERWNMGDRAPEKRLLVGEIDPEIRLEVAPSA